MKLAPFAEPEALGPWERGRDRPSAVRWRSRVPLPLLADPAGYVPCAHPLAAGSPSHAAWLGLFRRHLQVLLSHERRRAAAAGESADEAARRCERAESLFLPHLDAVGDTDVLRLCLAREDALEAAGIADAFALAKAEANDEAFVLLPGVIAELDALPAGERLARAVTNALAGNVYDLGAEATIAMHDSGDAGFAAVRARLRPRPWFTDGLDGFAVGGPWAKTVVLIDNAGPDVVLGVLPLARELLREPGARVVLAANARPSLNDVTVAELPGLLERAAAVDAPLAAALAEGRLRAVSSGNDAPLIDLSAVSAELVAEAAGAELLVIVGMGRGFETNRLARFRCDSLKICMLKDPQVAAEVGAELFDLVVRWEPAAG